MQNGYKFADGAFYDERLVPVKFIISTYGSEETFALFVSPKRKWRRESEFVASLKLFGDAEDDAEDIGIAIIDIIDIDVVEPNSDEHFLYLSIFFNDYMPEEITINPEPHINKKVLKDAWCCKSIMWEENKCYFAFLWMTTA